MNYRPFSYVFAKFGEDGSMHAPLRTVCQSLCPTT